MACVYKGTRLYTFFEICILTYFAINVQPVVNMPGSKCRVSYKQFTDFERGRMISMWEGGDLFIEITVRMGSNASVGMRV